MSYCNEMSRAASSKLSSLFALSAPFDDYLNKISGLSVNASINKGNIDTLNNVINTSSSIEDEIRSYAGSCLDGILDTSILGDFSSIYDLIPYSLLASLGPLMEMLKSLLNINELFNSLGLGELIDKINSLLGCLSFSDCNISGDIVSAFDVYTNKYQGFTSTGFDITEIGIGTPFENISGDIQKLGNQIEKTVKKSATIVPYKYF